MSLNSVLLCLFWSASISVSGQVLSGSAVFPGAQGRWLVLKEAIGGMHEPKDSVQLDAQGAFRFEAGRGNGAGFYQLALGDTDRVDIILNASEPMVALRFDGTPLQRHITVLESAENRLLWRYKAYSRECAAILDAVARERAALDPMDHRRLLGLDSIERQAISSKEFRLKGLVDQAPSSYFARVVLTGSAVDRAILQGPQAVAAAFDFSDPDLLRSSIYDKAVMSFLQSINVVSEEQITNASDTLIKLASGNAECLAYMIEHLVDVFAVYGPQGTLQHIVDVHLAGERPTVPMTPRLRAKVKNLLAVSIGAIGIDVVLVDTAGGTRPLSQLLEGHRLCALFFYSSTCDHCHLQMPGMSRLYAQYGTKGLQVVGIALDDDRTEFRTNIVQRGLSFPCFSEFNGWGSTAAKAYEVKATPTIILIDRDRRIVAKPYDTGALEEELRERLP